MRCSHAPLRVRCTELPLHTFPLRHCCLWPPEWPCSGHKTSDPSGGRQGGVGLRQEPWPPPKGHGTLEPVDRLCVSHFSRVQLCYPLDCNPAGSSVHGILQARILECTAISSPGDLPNLGIEPTSPVALAWQAGSFTAEPLGKPAYNSMELIISTPRIVVLL